MVLHTTATAMAEPDVEDETVSKNEASDEAEREQQQRQGEDNFGMRVVAGGFQEDNLGEDSPQPFE